MKKTTKNKTFLCIFLFSLIFTSLSFTLSKSSNIEFNEMALSDDPGSFHYQIRQSVTYQVEINISVTQLTDAATFYFKVPRLNDRQPNSSLTEGCPPYQESTLLYNKITGNIPGETIIGHHDKFNNTYDSYNASLSGVNPTVKLSQKYLTKLNEIYFDPIGDSDIGDFNNSDEIFSLYCNNSDAFYNRTDPNLISLSNSIVEPLDSVVTKAQKICNWVSDYLNYNQIYYLIEISIYN